jgi:cell division septal protein FtsQ
MRPKPKYRAKRSGSRIGSKLPKLLAIMCAAGLLVSIPFAALAAYRYVAALPFFAVRELQVFGLHHVEKKDFIAYMGDPRGRSIVGYDMPEVSRRLAAHPWIKDAVVRRDFPDTVRVEVTERVPAAVAETETGKYLIDTDGLALARVDSGWEFLPRVACPSARGLRLVDAKTACGFRHALELIAAVRREPTEYFAGTLAGVGEDGNPYLVYDGAVVKVGAGEYTDKIKRLSEVASDMKKRGTKASVIDLRFPGKVVVKEAKAEEENTATDSATPVLTARR